jgi:hypothetical protein
MRIEPKPKLEFLFLHNSKIFTTQLFNVCIVIYEFSKSEVERNFQKITKVDTPVIEHIRIKLNVFTLINFFSVMRFAKQMCPLSRRTYSNSNRQIWWKYEEDMLP